MGGDVKLQSLAYFRMLMLYGLAYTALKGVVDWFF